MDEQIVELLKDRLPLNIESIDLTGQKIGLVIVDEVNGFCTPKAGNLAPPAPDPNIERMVDETNELALQFTIRNLPILVFRDEHAPGQIEPPYPPHCWRGTGEELLVPKLKWLNHFKEVTVIPKDCINGFVGAITKDGVNKVLMWATLHQVSVIVVQGICTDICDMDFVVTMLSARNHGMMPALKEIVVHVPGTSTYNLPKEIALSLGLPASAAHPANVTGYMGLYFMASRGAKLASEVKL